MGLTAEQVQQYSDDGYRVLEALIRKAKRVRYQAIFDELVERSRSLAQSQGGYNLAPDEQGKPIPGRLHKIQGVCVVDERARPPLEVRFTVEYDREAHLEGLLDAIQTLRRSRYADAPVVTEEACGLLSSLDRAPRGPAND